MATAHRVFIQLLDQAIQIAHFLGQSQSAIALARGVSTRSLRGKALLPLGRGQFAALRAQFVFSGAQLGKRAPRAPFKTAALF